MQPLGIPTLTRGAPRALTREVWTWIEARRLIPLFDRLRPGVLQFKNAAYSADPKSCPYFSSELDANGEFGARRGTARPLVRPAMRKERQVGGLIRNAPSRPHLKEFTTWGFAAQNGRLLGRSRISPLLSEFFKPEGHLPPSYTSTSSSFAASREESSSASQARSVS